MIEHNAFDWLTLECMLQFMYEGDYVIKAATLEASRENHVNGSTSYDGSQPTFLPPHLRRVSAADTLVDQRQESLEKTPATNAKTAHALVYAIADHYELPKLRSMALEKFKDATETLSFDEFLHMANTIYRNTESNQDELRQELLLDLMTNHREWFLEQDFTGALTDDYDLREFTAAVVIALFNDSVHVSTTSRSYKEDQTKANHSLLGQLNQTMSTLAESEQRVEGLKTQVAQLQVDIQKFRSENSRLEGELSCALEYGQNRSEKANQNETSMKEAKEKLKNETTRANKYWDLCNQKDATVKAESQRANGNYDLCVQRDEMLKGKDAAIKAEKARADKACAIIKSVYKNVNSLEGCRNCGVELSFGLEKDDRTGGLPYNFMVRCLHCRCRQYGDKVV